MESKIRENLKRIKDSAISITKNTPDKFLYDFKECGFLSEQIISTIHSFNKDCKYLVCACSLLFNKDLAEIMDIVKITSYKVIVNEISSEKIIDNFTEDYLKRVYKYKPDDYFYNDIRLFCVTNLTEIIGTLEEMYESLEDTADVAR